MQLTQRQYELEQIPAQNVVMNAPMREHTTFKIGGPADALVLPRSMEEVQAVLRFCAYRDIPVLAMGNGSNLLVRDGGIRGVVLKIAESMDWVRVAGDQVVAGAGIALNRLAEFALSNSLAGLEFASGIPGTFGGAVHMNAGAYGGEMKDVVCRVEAVTTRGEPVTLVGPEIAFGYRDSALQQRNLLAVEATCSLVRADSDEILRRMRDLDHKRRSKQPLNMPSAGSTFRRPPDNYAGSLIEQAGLKGFRIGGAQVSSLHAGFVVNVGGASSGDVIALIEEVRSRVREQSGVQLVPEVKIVGEEL